MVDCEEALAKGLIHKVVEVADLESTVRQYATQMAANAPLTLAAAKATIMNILADSP